MFHSLRHRSVVILAVESLERRQLLSALSFSPEAGPAAGSFPYGAAAVDLNGDGKPDLVTANYDGSVHVLLGNGDGTFAFEQQFLDNLSNSPMVFAVGALTNSGHQDIVVGEKSQGVGAIEVLLGNGDGTFGNPLQLSLTGSGANVDSVVIGDLTNNGVNDIVVGLDNGTADVFFSRDTGTFYSAVAVTLPGNGPNTLALADVNGDHLPDLIAANKNSNKVSVLLNQSHGQIGGTPFNTTPTAMLAAGIGPTAVAVADINHDGNPDIVVGGTSGVVRVILGNGDGTFGKPLVVTTAVTQINSIAVADMDGDGNPDIVLGATRSTKGGKFDILLGNGDGTFQSPFILPALSAYPQVAVADLNGDGRFDLVAGETGNGSLGVLLNTTPTAPIIEVNTSVQGNVSAMGTAGNDTINLSLASGQVVIQVNGETNSFKLQTVSSISIFGALGNDSITIGPGVPAAFVSGGGGNDTIVADNSAANVLKGAMGRDSIVAGGGAEMLDGGMGADTLVAGIGNDTLTGDGANDSLMGGGGASVLDGGLGTNTLAAGAGNNTLLGNVGNDSIDGSGGGNDSLVGGGGMDTIIGATGSTGMDTIDPGVSTGILTPGPRDSVIGG